MEDFSDKDNEQMSELKRKKKNVERAEIYWKPNKQRFMEFQRFAFKSNLTPDDEASLNATQKPIIEFNIVNAPISKQCGEFSKQEPSIEARAEYGAQIDPRVIQVVDGHIRHILDEAKKQNTQYLSYRDSLSGGYFNFKVWTEYAHEMSFDQIIKVGRTYQTTMTGYDPMAREPDKSDAEFCYELFTIDKEQAKKDYPDINFDDLSYLKSEQGFNWSYKDQEQYIVVLCDYYEKKKVKKEIARLANNQVIFAKEYNDFIAKWAASGRSEQPPVIVEKRKSTFTTITRTRFIENFVLEEVETSWKYQPLVFGDGDSVVIQEDSSATMEQFTKPYIWHAKGLQRLTNFTGQVIANDFETMVMHKFMVAEEALPDQEEAMNAWTNVQQASLLVHKAYYNDNPELQLPIPQPVPRIGLPPEVTATFNNSMNMLQAILGSYDASLAAGDNQVSGKAIVESATLSNAAAMPYIVNYMQALTRVANIIVDLIPKYYKTPRTIPVIDKEGKRNYVLINQQGGVDMNYDSNMLQVRVEAGVNYSIAKNQAMNQLIMLMKVSPEFAEFMNDVGLETLLDNIEFRNSDVLKSKVGMWAQQKAQKEQQQPDPEVMKVQVMQQQQQMQAEEIKAKALLESEKVINERKKLDNERFKMMIDAGASHNELLIAVRKAEAEEARAGADLAIKHAELHMDAHDRGHQKAMDIAGHHHEVRKHEDEMKQSQKAKDNAE